MTDRAVAPPAGAATVNGADWEALARHPARPEAAPVLAIDGFEGPLDWLLEMARARRIDLASLSIVALVEAFSAALTAALAGADRRPLTLARWSGWLVMAADLTLLRSRLLVPADRPEARDALDAAEALRRHLVARAQASAAADWLERRDQLGRDVFRRGQVQRGHAGEAGTVSARRTGDITALLRACLAAIRLPADAAERYLGPLPPFWSPADAAARIRAVLPAMGQGGAPLAAFLPDVPGTVADRGRRCREAVASTFGAGLELARGGDIALEQQASWAPIQVRRGHGPSSGEAATQAA